MGKAFEPPLCIECKYHSFDYQPLEESQHLCRRMIKKQRSLVTGDEIETGLLFDCKLDRYGKSSHQCGYSARYFKEKE